MKTAKLLKDQIGIASGLTHLSDDSHLTQRAREMRRIIIEEYSKRASAGSRSYDREQSVPAQTVEVLDIFDQAENAAHFKTPTPSLIVARIKAKNFDGKMIETVVSISDLDIGASFKQDVARGVLQTAIEWMKQTTV